MNRRRFSQWSSFYVYAERDQINFWQNDAKCVETQGKLIKTREWNRFDVYTGRSCAIWNDESRLMEVNKLNSVT